MSSDDPASSKARTSASPVWRLDIRQKRAQIRQFSDEDTA